MRAICGCKTIFSQTTSYIKLKIAEIMSQQEMELQEEDLLRLQNHPTMGISYESDSRASFSVSTHFCMTSLALPLMSCNQLFILQRKWLLQTLENNQYSLNSYIQLLISMKIITE